MTYDHSKFENWHRTIALLQELKGKIADAGTSIIDVKTMTAASRLNGGGCRELKAFLSTSLTTGGTEMCKSNETPKLRWKSITALASSKRAASFLLARFGPMIMSRVQPSMLAHFSL